MINALFFDFGGTLDTDGIHWSEKFWDLYQKFNIKMDKKEYEFAYVQAEKQLGGGERFNNKSFKDILTMQISSQFKVLKSKKIINSDENRFLDKMIQYCYDDVRKTMRRSRELLQQMSRKYTLGIISNFYGNLKHVCKEFDIADCLTFFIDSEIVGIRKPDEGIYKLAVDSMHTGPEKLVMVGDSYERDIAPAKSVGCATIWLKGRTWQKQPEEHSKADYIINSINEIPYLNLFK